LASLEGEIVHLASISNDKILKSEVKNTYQKFIKGEVTTPTRRCSLSKENQDVTNSPSVKTPDTGNSFNQQSFEKRLKLAENKAKLELKSVKQSLSKRMGENAVLMQECDDLRTQNSELKSEMARLLHET
jgi:Na+-transporting NADH:ubiquinone oxidoreductase subunit NqrC